MFSRFGLITLVIFFVWVFACLLRPGPAQSQSAAPPPPDMAQFRVVVGLRDTAAKPWQGKIEVNGGQLARIEGYRFSQQDQVHDDGSFDFRTKVGALENQLSTAHPYGQTDWNDPNGRRLIPEGLVLRVLGSESAHVKFSSGTGSFEFDTSQVAFGKPLAALDANALVERMPVEQKLSEGGSADDFPSLAVAANGTRWTVWLAYKNASDVVMANGAGKTYALTAPGDHHAPAVVADGNSVRAVWSRNDGGTFHLYTSVFGGGWSKPEKLTGEGGSNLWPRLAADSKTGRVALVWQGFRKNQSVILTRVHDAKGWGRERQLSQGTGNCWAPTVQFGAGKLWYAWDSYSTGAYQIYVREAGGAIERVTKGTYFSVRPSVAVMSNGIPVVAWEESDDLWGKDFAFLFDQRGSVIYKNRRIRVAYLDGGEWKELDSPVELAVPAGMRRFLQQPQLAADGEGRLYLTIRARTSAQVARIDYWASGGRWETLLTWLEGDRWAPALSMPSSVGRNSMRQAVAIRGGQVQMAWPADNRPWPGTRSGALDVMAASIPATSGQAAALRGKPIVAAGGAATSTHPNETADTQRLRSYRYSLGGKRFRIVKGDLHRHTELSGDGAGDGMLDDLYRYTLDAAAMDYAHVGDHQMGNDEEYNWWITQKSNDLYYMPQRFVPMYGYERSVWWPNGHRNVVWAERGKPVLKIPQAEAKGQTNSGPILYPYLRETKGIATSHSSATEQGTDWRDNDPALEPLVEIYQGFESNYEAPGAPRAWKEGEKTVHQGLRPLGFVWNAWAKGYKLGVQASSDHVSTHTSFACILVEDFTRQGVLDAMRKRHAYAATDQIVMDFRVETPEGIFLMGDILSSAAQPKLLVKVMGTAPIKQIDVIRNNTYIHKINPNEKEASFDYVDRAAIGAETYYYVRAEQADGQLAWSSPIWVKKK